MKCVVCNENEANQKHHVSYEPELVIDICKECHQKIHQSHGVGKSVGEAKIKESHPFFTYTNKGSNTVYDSETDEELYILTCNCGSVRWELYGRENKSAVYIRCISCGSDRSITTMDTKQPVTANPQLKIDEAINQV